LQLVADKYFQYQKNFKSNKILNNVLLIINENAVFGYYILALILFPLLFFIIYLGYRIKKDKGSDQLINRIKKSDDNIISYLMTYVIPFLTAGINVSAPIVTNFVLFLIIMIIYIRMDLVYLNPTLILVGYNIYIDSNDDMKYLTRNSSQAIQTSRQNHEKLKVTRITDSFSYIAKRK